MSIITKREQQILTIIRDNPLISQKQLAEQLGLTRSSVAVHITNLMKKGLIRGKGYILNENNYVTVIGGSNIDIIGFPNQPLRVKDSNPGVVKISLGGVGRNIAENISRLGINAKLITAVGSDLYGKKIINESKVAGINMDHIMVLENVSSSTYLSVMNKKGDMNIAISHMEAIEHLAISYLKKHDSIIKNSTCLVLDTNLTKDVIEFLANNYHYTNIFVDTVSVAKSSKIKDLLPYIHTLKPNRYEAEHLTGITLNTEKSIYKALKHLLTLGVKNVVISMGNQGVYYGNENGEGHVPVTNVKVVNSTGAGDAFMAGLVYGYLNHKSLKKSCEISMAASAITLSSQLTINPNLNINTVKKIVKENY